ncbi:UNVERIFIED_CONTAM: hypothetical protein GTU68_006525, partial [Idotea baltica]|nr:hypothetical protein [Idotea baltica]
MNVLLLGGGAREHTMAWSISQSPLLTQLYISPGNGGTHHLATHVDLFSGFGEIADFVHQHNIDIIIVGPEVPLVDGIVDYMRDHAADVLIVGPDKVGAQLEGSKDYAKRFMIDEGIPTASYHTITKDQLTKGYQILTDMSPPYVLKADGLAAGKGVIITSDLSEARTVLNDMLDGQFGDASARVVIESFLTGLEFSVFALVDGSDYIILPIAKDYKRVGEGDTGPNTGGMGSISPVDFVDDAMRAKVEERIIRPTIAGL